MEYSKIFLPKKYWVYLIVIILLFVLLIANFYRTNDWTGDKEFSEYEQSDWALFRVFIIEECLILLAIIVFTVLLCRLGLKTRKQTLLQWEEQKYSDIKPGDYDYIWFDISQTHRVLVLAQKDNYVVYVQKYSDLSGEWQNVSDACTYSSLEKLKEALCYDFSLLFE